MSEAKVIVSKTNLDTIANAVRERYNESNRYSMDDLVSKAVYAIDAEMQEKIMTPGAEDKIIIPDEGYSALSSVTISGDSDLIAANIKRGVEIFGVKGKYSGPASDAATTNKMELMVIGDSFTLDGKPQSGIVSTKVDIGTNITLEYTGNGRFLHWIDQTGKLYGSGTTTCTYTINDETILTPVIISDILPGDTAPYSAYIEFMSEYSQIMGADTWSSADTPDQHTLPRPGMKMGYRALGWTLDGENVCTIQDIINSIDGSFAYKEIRALYEQVLIPVTITVGNNIDDTTFTVNGNRGVRSILTKPAGYENYDIYCWSLDKEGTQPIGYNATNYGMYAAYDTTIYIQYVPKGTAVQRLPGIALLEFYPMGDEEENSIIINIIRDIPSGYTVKSHGALYAFNGAIDLDNPEQSLVLGSIAAKTKYSADTSRRSSFSTRISMASGDTVLWARGYCVVADSNGVEQTIYTQVHNATYNELMAIEPQA